jgi:sugar/nucleoside kinase (ribokinase family)
MPFDVISAGILVADHLTAPIPRLPKAGELVLCEQMPFSIGGCAAVVGAVGGDPLGAFVGESLHKADVDVSGIVTSKKRDTSCSLIINVAGEDRRFITTLGANAEFAPKHIPLDEVRKAKVLYLGGYLFAPALESESMIRVFRAARKAGVKIVVAGEGIGTGTPWERLAPILAETDVFLPNEDEARLITGKSDPVAQAEQFRAAGAKTVVITCGGAGSILVSDNVRLRAGVYPIEYVGGTGSGDAFDAGYIMGLLAGGDESECLRWGSAIGASCVRSVSATDGVFKFREAKKFMAEHKLAIRAL